MPDDYILPFNRLRIDDTRLRYFPDKNPFKYFAFFIKVRKYIEAKCPSTDPPKKETTKCYKKLDSLLLHELEDLIWNSKEKDWMKSPYFFQIATVRLLELRFPHTVWDNILVE